MTIQEVLDVFEDYTRENNMPFRFIDLYHMRLVGLKEVRDAYRPIIESITEADIERQTSRSKQRRRDVIKNLVQITVKYAIFSHTWFRSDEEHRYYHMMSDAPRSGPGWEKLEHFCGLARDSFLCRFAWADTLCIDFKIKADHQLAIQSMFRWYRNAYICIAYLPSASGVSDMGHDEWFRRGFTLTELLAPIRMKFYGAGWKALNNVEIDNDKADARFLELLSKASRVPTEDLRMFRPGPDRIRQKLSWASGRKTTIIEDKAYSLMAILDSHMDIRYGEGEKAFTRLMMEAISKSRECDIFAWAGPCSPDHAGIPPSSEGFGEEYRDQELNLAPHYYRECGDRFLSFDLNRLRIRVVVLEISLPLNEVTSYIPVPLWHAASIAQVTLLHPPDLVLRGRDDVQMAVGVVDYNRSLDDSKGVLHKGARYFGFLLYKSPEVRGWRKLLTDKVVFLINERDLVKELDMLDITTK